MNGKRVAVVAAHPAQLLTIAGVLQRWHPDVLVLFRAARGRDDAACAALRSFGLAERLTSLEIDESASYAGARAGDFAFHAAVADRLFAWLRDVRPDAVLGNAYEACGYHTDVARLLLDDAVQRWRSLGRRIENYEFPLSCGTTEPGGVQYGAFRFGPFRTLRLSDLELITKRELVAAVARTDPLVASAAPLFARPEVEQYRDVPADRDYTAPPPGLALLYDEQGRAAVTTGRHPEEITFREHFAPLVRALGLAPFVRTAA
jgi:hypothetical protein